MMLARRIEPDKRLAAAFSREVARWSRERGALPDAVLIAQHAALLVSQATSDGHSCSSVDELLASLNGQEETPLDDVGLRALLMESQVVGSPDTGDLLPLVLDEGRLYLHRYFDYERRLANSLAVRSIEAAGEMTARRLTPAVLALLECLFDRGSVETTGPDWQKIAAVTALLGRLTVISGGPGTGKTTTVVNLIACLLEADPNSRIVLAAPTGKAAARMTEVIRHRAAHLPEALRARLPSEAFTIHRLLGGTAEGQFRHHNTNQLPIDVLIIDEASMLNLALAVHLLDAVPANTRIVLLGDKDQLVAVESGAVFSELSARPTFSPQRIEILSHLCNVAPETLRAPPDERQSVPVTRTGLDDCVVWLRRNYRFGAGSTIGLLAAEINEGKTASVLARLGGASDRTLAWINDVGNVPSTEAMQAIFDGYAPYIAAMRDGATDPRAITAAFRRLRVLCAVREGPFGVEAVNQRVSTHFRRMVQHPLDSGLRSPWYPGQPVMIMRNDHALKLFNGDIGIVLPDERERLQVFFPDETGEFRAIAPGRLPEHATAFAMTVHKAQGSEFDEIVLMLPAEKNRMLTRALIYTAVTRARSRVSILANVVILSHSIETAPRRSSGLLSALRKAAQRQLRLGNIRE